MSKKCPECLARYTGPHHCIDKQKPKSLNRHLEELVDSQAEKILELIEALGCAVEALESRHPLNEDDLIAPVIKQGREVLKSPTPTKPEQPTIKTKEEK